MVEVYYELIVKKKNYDETCRNMYIEIEMWKYDEICRNYVWDVLSQRSLLAAWREDPRSKATKLMRVSFVMGDPQVTMGFNTKSWSFMT